MPGHNAIGVILSDGWFRGRLGFGRGKSNIWGEQLALLAQLEIQYADGSSERIVSDENWRAATGPILMSSLYDGETYDARLEHPGWSSPGFDDSGWSNVQKLEWDLSKLEAPFGPPVRRIERLMPVSISQSPSGRTIVDFGQNLVGRLHINVQGLAGQMVTFRHAEVLENGELCTRPLRAAQATDRYTLCGGGVETWEPRFTFHGFRYAEVDSWPGDLQVFSPTATFLYDVSGFLQSWLADLAIEQRKLNGVVPPVIPNALGQVFGAAAWADAATVVPWVLYQRFGDSGILEAQFDSMRAWIDHVASLTGEKYLWDNGFQYGDWLDPSAPPNNPGQARTDKAIIASAYFAYSAELLGRAAAVIGRSDDKNHYLSLAARVREAFARQYITPDGRLMSDAETAYALALVFDLLPRVEQRQCAGERLAKLVRQSGYHIRTGFVGTPLICDALCSTGHHLIAYRLLMQRSCPSWLYPVTMGGATTVWERWDSMLPDGSINPGEMTSFNHYALGAVVDWIQRTMGGLNPVEPGYKRMEICPRPGGGLTHCRTTHITPYGLAGCTWKIKAGNLDLDVVIPPNTTALVTLPGNNVVQIEVGSGSWNWTAPYQDPDARASVTVDDMVGEIMTDDILRAVILEILAHTQGAGFLVKILNNEKHLTLRQVFGMIPNSEGLLAKISEAIGGPGREIGN